MKMQIKTLTLKRMKERTVMLSFFFSYLQVSAGLFKLRGNSQLVRTIFSGNAEMDTKRLKVNEQMELLRVCDDVVYACGQRFAFERGSVNGS